VRFKKVREIDPDILRQNSQYIAGLMDGEGSFSIIFNARTKRPYFRPLLTLDMDHEETIRFVADKFGVDYKPASTKRKSQIEGEVKVTVRTMYVTHVFVEDDIKKVLTTLLPSLITKKKQAELILEFIRMKRDFSGTRVAYKDLLLKQAEIYSKVRRLHKKGRPFDYDKFRKKFDEAIRRMQ
jgi:hypothetical protein